MKFPKLTALASFALSASMASGTVLLLDFGPTTPTGANLTNSPYHTVTAGTESTWNVLGTADSSSLVWGNGNAATGVAIDLGVSPNNSIINFSSQPGSSSALGTQYNSGVFAGDSVGTDGIFSGTGTQANAIGLKITGLTVGLTYEVFVVGINTNSNPMRGSNIGALATTNVGTLDIGALSTVAVSISVTNVWEEGSNYARFSVTLTSDDPVLTIFTTGVSGAPRGFLNSVQITAIPEPSTYAALLGLLALGFVAWRRRR